VMPMQKTCSLLNGSYQRVRYLLMTTRRQSFLLICFIAIALTIGTLPVNASKTPVPGKTLIIVGGEIGYPPYSFLDKKGNPTGFQVELTRAIARTMGMNVEIRITPWPETRKALEDGTIDIIPGMFYSEERAKIYDFSPPFSIVSTAIFARVNSPSVKSIEDLRDREIIVMRGEVMHDYILKHRLTDRIMLTETPADALRLLASGKGDYALVAQMPGLYWIKELNLSNIKSVGPSLQPFKNCFAVRKGNTLLLSRFTEGLSIINSTGEYSKLYEKWLGVLAPTGIDLLLAIKYAAIVFVPLIVLLALSFVWSWLLRNKVNQKTRALQESEERYRNLFENAHEAIFVAQDGNLVFLNLRTATQIGYSLEEIKSKSFIEFIHQDDQEMVINNHIKRMKGEEIPNIYSFRVIHKDGSVRWTELNTVSIDWDGKPATLNFMTDITEHKQAEEALKESATRLTRAEKTAKMGNWKLMLNTREFIGSPGAQTIYGAESGVLSFDDARKCTLPEYIDILNKGLTDLITKDIPYNLDIKICRPTDGKIIDIHSIAEYDKDNNIVYGVIQDITEQRKAAEERRDLQERLNRAEKMEALGTLAGGVAHDLNNVLGVVVGYAELTLDSVDKTSPLRHGLENIMNGGQKAAAIVDDLLTLARRGVPVSSILNLNTIIANFQNSPELNNLSFHHPDVKIKTNLDPDLLNISGSSVHLGKSLYNLISNAHEAMTKGGTLTIKTTNQYLDKPMSGYNEIREGDYVVLTISDTGEGISEKDLKRIFEPFYTKKIMGRSGTGLGLAVVWGTVTDHNGYINVHSEEGKGSTFTLYFPVTREEIPDEALAIDVSAYMGSGQSILIVDDVSIQRELARDMLQKLNYNVSSVKSGEEAILYLKDHQPDLIVLDMIMDPGMDGLDTYKSIIKINPKQKTIIVSGFSESDRVKEAKRLGAGAYVRKPYIKEKLGMAVKKELGIK